MQLTVAQCQEIERAHACGGRFSARRQFHKSVYERQTAQGLVNAGLARLLGEWDDGYADLYELTDAGRRAYATNGRILRHYRCDNPVCCGTWPGDDPAAPPSHGSCPRCSRWIAVTRDGLMKRHTIQPGHQCPGVGQLREGAQAAAVTWPARPVIPQPTPEHHSEGEQWTSAR